ncbi:DUF4811 domain-containing protein [Companilactobacillus versmoldensis]|uniref:DUF4811 domain-containing protein n=1 Tax=Companilactobacillus versmoldensis DSM 14857 = KCTC 3814 TaxID=1423815 RepID=A0A0R1SAW1_9LACO|nr:DUF4811 domain-containing protein [Companilactobacillus versmoldensis]KRL65625.1 hypothetical protein FC27_GL001518 [Companilactobacillus versmoldensis DSM 14857 = KCTC 3814]
MIQISILVLAALAYFCAVFVKNKRVGYSFTTVFIVLLIGATVSLVLNEQNHFGMEKVVSQKTIPIQTVKKGSNLLLYKELGNKGKERVYVYRTPSTENAKKPNTTKADINVKNKVKVGDYNISKIDQKTTRWEYKNGFYSFLFNLSNNNNEFVSQKNTFKIGQDWLVLTTKQANALNKKLKDKSVKAQMQQEGEAYVKKVVAQEMQANPSMSSAQQKKVVSEAQNAYKLQAVKDLVKDLK